MTLDDVMKQMTLRFTSANSVPVERAHIRHEEWEILKAALAASAAKVEPGQTVGTLHAHNVHQAECPHCESETLRLIALTAKLGASAQALEQVAKTSHVCSVDYLPDGSIGCPRCSGFEDGPEARATPKPNVSP